LDAGARRWRYRTSGGCGWKLGPTVAARSQLEASFLVQVKNPDSPSGHSSRGGGDDDRFHSLQSKRRVMLPHLQGTSGRRRYAVLPHRRP
jgi:hypothetical protein